MKSLTSILFDTCVNQFRDTDGYSKPFVTREILNWGLRTTQLTEYYVWGVQFGLRKTPPEYSMPLSTLIFELVSKNSDLVPPSFVVAIEWHSENYKEVKIYQLNDQQQCCLNRALVA